MTKSLKLRKPKKQQKLTANQRQILQWIIKDRLTVKQIAKRKGLLDNSGKPKTKSIYNTIQILKKKGYLNKSISKEQEIFKEIPKNKFLRLHAIAFTIKILYHEPDYLELLKIKNQDIRDSNTIELYNNKLKIYLNKDFWGESIEECFNNYNIYLNKFLKQIENDYNIILIKPRNTKIYRFRMHIADIRNPLSKQVIENKKHFKVTDDNGDIRLIIDNSFIPEFEAVNNLKAKDDMQREIQFHKDLITNPQSFNLSSLTKLCNDNTITLNRLSKQLLETNKRLQLTIELQQQTIITQNNLIKIITPKQNNIKDDNHIYGTYFI